LSGEAGHFCDDRFFLTAIQTQGLLLQNVSSVSNLGHAYFAATFTVRKNSFWRDRHLRWLGN